MEMNPVRNLHSRFSRKFIISVVIVLVVVYFSFLFYGKYIWLPKTTDGYQAVFLNSGQVYFGKLGTGGGWFTLSDIYYLQATESLQQTGTVAGRDLNQKVQLIKLGTEIHGPLDVMYIAKGEISFWENLKEDSKVVEAIKRDKSNQKIIDSKSGDKF